MYLHHILTRREDALITRAFWAQVNKPLKSDWCNVVNEDLQSIGLGHISYENMINMGQDALRELLKRKINEAAFIQLRTDKDKSSKMKSLRYCSLALQPYLTAESNLSIREKRLLFRWRSHMIKVKHNFGLKAAQCPLCKEANDTQYHLLTCPTLVVPQPWNIQSVESALRQREVMLEQEREKSAMKDNGK